MSNFDVSNATFISEIRQLESTDSASPDTFNIPYGILINNCVALKNNLDTVHTTLETNVSEVLKNSSKLDNANANIMNLAFQIEMLNNSELQNMTSNVIIETFTDIDDVTITHGFYNATTHRVELNGRYIKAVGVSYE